MNSEWEKGRERKKNDMSGVKNDDRHNYSKNYEPLRCWSYARGNSSRRPETRPAEAEDKSSVFALESAHVARFSFSATFLKQI